MLWIKLPSAYGLRKSGLDVETAGFVILVVWSDTMTPRQSVLFEPSEALRR